MIPHAIIHRLESTPAAVAALVDDLPLADARFKPPSGAWSVLEIVCHLADEEIDDFRRRLKLTLTDPAADWPPIDPEGWARDRRYNEQDLAATLDRFTRERAASVAWLRQVLAAAPAPDWSRAKTHPTAGPLRAGDLLAAWAAHDALHIRQIAKRLHELAARDGDALGGFHTKYAGDWGA